MPTRKPENTCPECGGLCVVISTRPVLGSMVARLLECDQGHRHTKKGERTRVNKKKEKEPLWKGPILTEWRPIPIWPVIV